MFVVVNCASRTSTFEYWRCRHQREGRRLSTPTYSPAVPHPSSDVNHQRERTKDSPHLPTVQQFHISAVTSTTREREDKRHSTPTYSPAVPHLSSDVNHQRERTKDSPHLPTVQQFHISAVTSTTRERWQKTLHTYLQSSSSTSQQWRQPPERERTKDSTPTYSPAIPHLGNDVNHQRERTKDTPHLPTVQ